MIEIVKTSFILCRKILIFKENRMIKIPEQNRGRVQTHLQMQANLQMTDDTWERLIRACERLEAVTDQNIPVQSANRQNFHRHRNEMPESVYEAEMELHLQIKAFWHVVAPLRGDKKTIPWLLKDFICWLGGRERVSPQQLGKTDQYVIPVIQCVLGERFNLPELDTPEVPIQLSEKDIMCIVTK
jgi:hypothetical protein